MIFYDHVITLWRAQRDHYQEHDPKTMIEMRAIARMMGKTLAEIAQISSDEEIAALERATVYALDSAVIQLALDTAQDIAAATDHAPLIKAIPPELRDTFFDFTQAPIGMSTYPGVAFKGILIKTNAIYLLADDLHGYSCYLNAQQIWVLQRHACDPHLAAHCPYLGNPDLLPTAPSQLPSERRELLRGEIIPSEPWRNPALCVCYNEIFTLLTLIAALGLLLTVEGIERDVIERVSQRQRAPRHRTQFVPNPPIHPHYIKLRLLHTVRYLEQHQTPTEMVPRDTTGMTLKPIIVRGYTKILDPAINPYWKTYQEIIVRPFITARWVGATTRYSVVL